MCMEQKGHYQISENTVHLFLLKHMGSHRAQQETYTAIVSRLLTKNTFLTNMSSPRGTPSH